MKLKYEKGRGAEKPAMLDFFVQSRTAQMRYTKPSVQSGVYGSWLSQVTEEELQTFIKENTKRLEKGLTYKTYGPTLHSHLITRNALYELELLTRASKGSLSDDVLDRWEDEYKADLIYWQGKYEVAMAQFHAKRDRFVKVGQRTPYY